MSTESTTGERQDDAGYLSRSPAKPSADTKKPIVANPSTPGIQTPNTPTGRTEPDSGTTR
jgi:hypothetical protein